MNEFWQYLIIFLILLVGAKDLAMGFARKRGWINGKEPLEKKMDELQQHYNDETTTILKDIKDEVRDGNKQHERMMEILVEIKSKK